MFRALLDTCVLFKSLLCDVGRHASLTFDRLEPRLNLGQARGVRRHRRGEFGPP